MSHEGNDKATDNQRDEKLKVIEVHHFEMDGKPASLTITEPPKNVADLARVVDYIYNPSFNYRLTHNDRASWIAIIWDVINGTSEVNEGRNEDEEWDDVCTAMAWIMEEIGVRNELDQ